MGGIPGTKRVSVSQEFACLARKAGVVNKTGASAVGTGWLDLTPVSSTITPMPRDESSIQTWFLLLRELPPHSTSLKFAWPVLSTEWRPKFP